MFNRGTVSVLRKSRRFVHGAPPPNKEGTSQLLWFCGAVIGGGYAYYMYNMDTNIKTSFCIQYSDVSVWRRILGFYLHLGVLL
eukprot:UN03919